MKTSNEYKFFQYFCLQEEYKNRFKDSVKYEKALKDLMDNLLSILSSYDFNQLQKYSYDRSKPVKEKTIVILEET